MKRLIITAVSSVWTICAIAQPCTVDWNDVHQQIDGFGASSAWRNSLSTAQADMFFSTNTGIGLSLLRNHITFANTPASTATPTTSETGIMNQALARGARVWSAPWTPAAGFKGTNQNGVISVNGGTYRGSGGNATNLAYAKQLANYVVSMKNRFGSNVIYALSVQNEPDFNTVNYESCVWTGQQFHDFVTNLSAALASAGMGSTRIIIPESEHWSGGFPSLYTPTLNDPATAAAVSIIANHNYDGCPPLGTPGSPGNYGKAVWETEVSKLNCAGAFDGSITDGLYWAGRIHQFLTVAGVSAWHYWWLISNNPDNEGLTDQAGNPAKRMYVLGQWSRFVRPGYYRIGTANGVGLQVSAFKDPASLGFAIVVVNSGAADVNETFWLTNFPGTSTVTPWITSASLSLSSQTSVPLSGSTFNYVVPAQSVVTFVGQALLGTPPVLVPVPDQTVDPGVTLVLTNVATDLNQPPPPLSFSLLDAPANATLDAASGVFNWRPLLSQADSTNVVTVQVTQNGEPFLDATNSFYVIVNPLTPTTLNSLTLDGAQATLVIHGPSGPDYTVLTSTNLLDWQVWLTTNAPGLPLTLVDTNAVGKSRFYRVELGP